MYRVLTQFEAAGIVARHNFDDGHSVYELASEEHHDHMVDVDTGKVIEFVNERIERCRQRSARSTATNWSITSWCCSSEKSQATEVRASSAYRAALSCK